MACFVVPMVVGILTTLFSKKISPKYHIEWFNMLIWGGSLMLAVEHYAHGEIVPFFPFLTAATEGKEAIQVMLIEMATIGSAMLFACIGLWLLMVIISPKLTYLHPKAKISIPA
jgi:hypothetical protein